MSDHTGEYRQGDRVLVTDPGLAMLRDIMRKYGEEPKPNHHGTVEEVWDDGTVLIHFDDGSVAPYPPAEVRPLTGAAEPLRHVSTTSPQEPSHE